MPTIKFPLEFNGDGSLVSLEDDADELFAQVLTISALTEPGTFPFTPGFGVYDPVFRTVDRGAYMLQAARFVPEIVVTNVEGTVSESGGTTSLKVTFRRA